MNRIIVGVASLAGASTIALSLLATPAFAADSATASKPTETLTHNVTVQEFVTSGVKAKFTGLTANGQYQLVIATSASGGPVGGTLTANSAGDLTTKYVATNPGKKHLSTLVGGQYSLELFGNTGEVVSKTFAVKYGSKLSWNSSHRVGEKLTVTATAKRWNPTTGKYVAWHNATVKFQEKIQEKKGAIWKTVKTVKTSAKGIAKTTIKAGKHTWRAVVSGNATVWTSQTGTHKK